ncbi:MAG: hypothetical protein HFJ65_08565 [Eggerthellaceae bacterium]|nr:hypothetical protein [Eggerthellaceae bacterium]
MNEETQSRNTEGTIKIDDKEYVLVAIESSSDHKASYIPYMKVSRNAQLEFDCRNDFSSSDFTPSLFSALSMLFMIGFPTMMLPSIPGLERYSYASIIGAFLVSIVVISLLVYGISRACINSGIRKLDENEEAIFESFEKAGHRLLTPPFSYDRITAADCLPSGQIVSMVSKAIHPGGKPAYFAYRIDQFGDIALYRLQPTSSESCPPLFELRSSAGAA